MELFTALAMITKHTLGLLETKEARKYIDRIIALESMKHEELKKNDDLIDHGFLDNLDRELCLIAKATAAL